MPARRRLLLVCWKKHHGLNSYVENAGTLIDVKVIGGHLSLLNKKLQQAVHRSNC